MNRVGVFIGVNQTGQLRRLNDAVGGAKAMHQWALSQGMVDHVQARLIVDEDGQLVTPDRISNAISELLQGAGVDQLLLYFAGHGVNIGRCEHWLLSEAPQKAYAAVNVNGSVELARYCGAQHVVVISDACRVAPEGIQAQSVRGVEVFPNDAGASRARPVDQFYACLLGKTAAELQDPLEAAGNYRALYTTALLDALYGRHPDLMQPLAGLPADQCVLRPLRLEAYLEAELPQRIVKNKLLGKVNQSPDAILAASDTTWISRQTVSPEAKVAPDVAKDADKGADKGVGLDAILSGLSTLQRGRGSRNTKDRALPGKGVLTEEVTDLLSGLVKPFPKVTKPKVATNPQVVRRRVAARATARAVAEPFGPDHFETRCGFKVRGAEIVKAALRDGEWGINLLGNGELMRLEGVDRPQSVVVKFRDGRGTVLPALPGFLAALSFEDGELVDVAYEPAVTDALWPVYEAQADKLRKLRAGAAAASLHGRFKLSAGASKKLLRQSQYDHRLDPTMAVYAAYAYHDAQALEDIQQLSNHLLGDLGARFFDVALLARHLLDRDFSRGPAVGDLVVPFVPMLTQGWSLLGANRVRLHPLLATLDMHLSDSVWSLYSAEGTDMLFHALQTQELT